MPTDPPPVYDFRSIRLAHLGTESAIKSLGQFCYLVGFLSLLGVMEFVLVALGILPYDPSLQEIASPGQIRGFFWALSILMLLNTAAQGALGFGLTRLQVWVRWTVVVLTAVSLVSHVGFCIGLCFVQPVWGLLALVIGGAIHLAILYPMLTPSSGVVFSRAYKDVIRATPEIRSRIHWLLKCLILLIVSGVVSLGLYLLAIYRQWID